MNTITITPEHVRTITLTLDQEMIRKTDGNLEKQKMELSKRAERKLEKLHNPTTSVPKTKKSRKGKSHNPPRTAT